MYLKLYLFYPNGRLLGIVVYFTETCRKGTVFTGLMASLLRILWWKKHNSSILYFQFRAF
jgi:hypothetical protein